MRLKENQITHLCQKILTHLKTKQLVHFKKSEPEALAKMVEIFVKDLKVEDEINRQAEQILQQYTAKMGSNIDKEKMFQMIKKQLVKDRGVIL